MELFLDNDIILKLSAIRYLQNLESLFNAVPDSIYILPTAKSYINNSSRIRKKYGQETINYASSIINSYSIIPDNYINESRLILLSDIENIDSGEQMLFSVDRNSSEYLISTGDKKSIKQLASISEIVEYLNHKIVCLEYIIHKFATLNFDDLLKSISLNFCYDIEIKNIFNQQNLTKEKALEGLLSYYNDLKAKSGSLLLEL